MLTFLLTIPAVIVWSKLLNRFVHATRVRRGIAFALTFGMMPFVYKLFIVPWFLGLGFFPTKKFDRRQWFSRAEKRYEMTEDLLEKNLIGKTKQDIQQLLGKGEETADEKDEWSYNLGSRPGIFVIYPDELRIEFEGQKVIRINWLHPVQMPL